MEDFVRFALSEGFTSYGFSSHAPLPFSTAWTMEWDIMDDYLSEFHRLKEKYAGRIELYIGLEIDYLNVIRPSPVSGSCRWTTVLVLYIFSTMTKGKWWM
jgi:HisJ family histidinol phosphate phosphatase